MTEAASDTYEIVLKGTSKRKAISGWILVLITNLMSYGQGTANPGGRIISVVHKRTGKELFRHIEEIGDDEATLLSDIERDLESMTVQEFEEAWVTVPD